MFLLFLDACLLPVSFAWEWEKDSWLRSEIWDDGWFGDFFCPKGKSQSTMTGNPPWGSMGNIRGYHHHKQHRLLGDFHGGFGVLEPGYSPEPWLSGADDSHQWWFLKSWGISGRHHGCSNTKSWSMTWMTGRYPNDLGNLQILGSLPLGQSCNDLHRTSLKLLDPMLW